MKFFLISLCVFLVELKFCLRNAVHYVSCRCASLLHDSVESEFFVIDGDSLMVQHALNNNFYEGQNLHFFYSVEAFLFDITQKGAKYVIVFFKVCGYPDYA